MKSMRSAGCVFIPEVPRAVLRGHATFLGDPDTIERLHPELFGDDMGCPLPDLGEPINLIMIMG